MYKFENNAYKKGYKLIVGLDEVGRGCIAGPIVCAAVILPYKYKNKNIKDSKMLSSKKREELSKIIIKNCIDYSIIEITPENVDKLNPKKSSILGMEMAINKLKISPDFALIDYEKISTNIENISIIKGDQKSISIAAASIIAKVHRDNLMIKMSKLYPQYSFDKNKGYLTNTHKEAIKKFGPILKVHRYSYKPIKK